MSSKIPDNLNWEYLINKFNDNNYVVFDVETDLIDKNISIFTKTPEFVLGVVFDGKTGLSSTFEDCDDLRMYVHKSPIIVGHNLAFDLKAAGIVHSWVQAGGIYWDTAIAEYEMTGQSATYPSLQQLADKYCPGESKESSVSEMIKAGVSPKNIPKNILAEYCKIDVDLTTKIFIAQMYAVETSLSFRQINLLLERMAFRMVTYNMSVNGLTINNKMLEDDIENINTDITVYELDVYTTMKLMLDKLPPEEVNPNSLSQISTVLFGGTYDYITKECIGEYKTGAKKGEPRYRSIKNTATIEPQESLTQGFFSKPGKLDETTLLQVKDALAKAKSAGAYAINFIDSLLKYRELNKNLSTYFVGYRDAGSKLGNLLYLNTEYKHTTTPTGRISSTKPNVQNLKGG